MRIFSATLVLLTLASCASPEKIAAQRAYEQQQLQAQQQAYTQNLVNQCRAIGYQENTDSFRNCVLQLHTNNQQQNAQIRGVLLQEALQRQYQSMPLCSSLPAGTAGYARAQGTCR